MNCRHCNKVLEHLFVDLGSAPPSNAYRTKSELNKTEVNFPLRILVCGSCWLVQTEDFIDAGELFTTDYAYFSSTSISWLEHAKEYSKIIREKLNLNANSFVVEIASNDGYLLKNFVETNIPCLGIEPTNSTAKAAENIGIPVKRKFFGYKFAKELITDGNRADLIIGNNVYAHVPDINDFTKGIKTLLSPEGTVTLEFAYLKNLIEENEFDTIYHEHFSYLSLHSVKTIFDSVGLKIYDVEELSTHGGSLRIYGCHQEVDFTITKRVQDQLQIEKDFGLLNLETYVTFQQKAEKVKNDLISFLIHQKDKGNSVVGYGAAAKGNTLINYSSIKPDLLPFVCDAAPSKQ